MANKLEHAISAPQEQTIDMYQILDQLDRDPQLIALLGKWFDGEEVREIEFIHASNMVEEENGVFKIKEDEFDRMIHEAIEEVQKDEGEETETTERIFRINNIAKNKHLIVQRVEEKLRELGYSDIEKIADKRQDDNEVES